MSRKIVATVLLLSATAFILAPWWVGGEVRTAVLDNMLYLLPADLRRQVEVTELDYERGWFSSQARYQVAVTASGDADISPLLVELDINHGPWLRGPGGSFPGLATIRVQPRLQDTDINDALQQLSISLPELTVDLRVGIDQRIDLSLAMAPLQISEQSGQLSFAGLEGYVIANADLSAQGFISVGEITAAEAGTSFVMEGIEIESGTEQISDLLAPSFAMLAIPAIRSNQGDGFAATDIQASARLSATPGANELLDISQQVTIKELQSSLPPQSLNWELDIRELPVSLLRSYSRLATALQEQLNSNGGTFDTQVNTLAQQLGLELLRSPMLVDMSSEVRAYNGKHRLNLILEYDGMSNLGDLVSISWQTLIAALTINIDMDLDLEAVLRSPAAGMIDTYVQQGFIVVDSGRVRLQGSLADSQLQLNSQSFPIGQFF